jgi:hypothetical protein
MKFLKLLFCFTAFAYYHSASATTLDTLTICNGQTVNINGTVISSAGQYSITYQPGDSVVIYTVYVSTPFVSLGDDIVVCERTIGMLIPQGSGGYYTWNNGMIADSVFIGVSGTYSVTLTDAYGCTASDAIEVTIMPNPNPFIDGIPDPLCYPANDIVLNGLPAGGSFSGDLINNNIFLASQAAVGFYNIYYTYSDAFGCSATVNAYVQVALCTGLDEDISNIQIAYRHNQILLNKDFHYSLYSIDGKRIQQSISHNKVIDLSSMQSGIYLLELIYGNERKCFSFYHTQ